MIIDYTTFKPDMLPNYKERTTKHIQPDIVMLDKQTNTVFGVDTRNRFKKVITGITDVAKYLGNNANALFSTNEYTNFNIIHKIHL